MKTIISAFKYPITCKTAALIALNGVTIYLIYRYGFDAGAQAGARAVLNTAESMTPGFGKQLQDFATAAKVAAK